MPRRMSPAVLWLPLALFALLLVVPATATAQGGTDAPDRPFALGVAATATARADLGDDRGRVSVTRFAGTARYRLLSLRYERDVYDWDDVSDLPLGDGSGDPWSSLHQVCASLSDHGFVDERWGWFWNLTGFSAYEDETGDSFGGAAAGGALYAFSRTVQVRAGVSAMAHPVTVRLLPVLGVDINRQAGAGWSAALGLPRTEVRYRWSETWDTRLAASYDSTVYRLADDSPVERKGYVRSSAVPVGLYQDFRSGSLTCTVGLEYRFMRDLTVYNDDGEQRNGYEIDAAPGVMFGMGYAF